MGSNAKFAIISTIVGIAVLIIVGYAYYQSREFITGPALYIESPQNGVAVRSPLLIIKGRATNISYLSLNDGLIFTGSDGSFNRELLLAPGYNIIKIRAQDKFGKSVEKILEVVYIDNGKGLATTSSASLRH